MRPHLPGGQETLVETRQRSGSSSYIYYENTIPADFFDAGTNTKIEKIVKNVKLTNVSQTQRPQALNKACYKMMHYSYRSIISHTSCNFASRKCISKGRFSCNIREHSCPFKFLPNAAAHVNSNPHHVSGESQGERQKDCA